MKKMYEKVVCGGMDVHYKFSRVTFRDAKGEVVCRERLEHPDRKALAEHLSQWPPGIPIAMEGSFGWQWIAELMLQQGLNPQLANSLKVDKMREARGWAKTNKKDADLVSLLPLEKTDWWRVWMAPSEVRDRREWMRYRADLVQTQTRTKNRIHAVFHRHGVFHEFSDLFGVQGRKFLDALCQDGGGRLSGGALRAFRGYVSTLTHIRIELIEVMKELHKHLLRTPLTCHLRKHVPGFGAVLPHVVVAEVGDMARFGYSHRRLAAYSLLAPRAWDSGKETDEPAVGRKLGHRGNRTLKWAFLEAARGAVRKGGHWRELWDRHTQGGKKDKNRGYLKVARQLCKLVVREWHKAVFGPEESSLVRQEQPARRAKHRRRGRGQSSTRSGTGALNHPMVEV